MEADETPEDRLEAALERIAKTVDAPGRVAKTDDAPDPIAAEVAARLDRIIATLRDALGK